MSKKLLFVCLGNICRSPAAENIMRHLVEKAGLGDAIVCDSAGTSAYHVGSRPDPRMSRAAMAYGLTLVGRARQFEPADFERFDLILAMDRSNYEDILAQDRQGRYHHKVKLMCDFCRHHSDREVPDPYYGGPDGFNYVLELLFDACEGLLDYLTQAPIPAESTAIAQPSQPQTP
ncbi:low molecular weight protein-tyrosine-phosphatase [Trichothermofontia sp.]